MGQLMYRVIAYTRAKAWGCARIAQRVRGDHEREIADLMDTIHNIPLFLTQFEKWDDEKFKKDFLDVYDSKWSSTSGLKLRDIYERSLNGEKNLEIFPTKLKPTENSAPT